MKTAMQELIEYIGYKKTNPIVAQLLEKEKRQIMDAYKAAITIDMHPKSKEIESEDYYNETFKP